MRVLLVEDEPLIAIDMECMVVECGHTCVGVATDRMAAMSLAGRAQVAFVDFNLSDGATGREIGRRLALEHGVTVIYTTSEPEDLLGDVEGVLGVLPKPVSAAEVNELLAFLDAGPSPTRPALPGRIRVFAPAA